MKFLTQYDIDVMIKPDYLNQITTSSIIMNNAERSAIAEASSHITQRFDTDYLFRSYVTGATVAPGLTGVSVPADGRLLWVDGFVYVNSLTQSVSITNQVYPGSTFSATQSWGADDRQLILVDIIVHIFLFQMIIRVEPRRVEEIRKFMYDESIKSLKQYARGEITLVGITTANGLRPNNQGVSIYWGSDYDTNFDINSIGYSNRPGLYGSQSSVVDPFDLQNYRP
jgi:hypothetical protein